MDAETLKIRLLQNWPGWLFLSLTVLDYDIIAISKSFGHSKTPITGFRHSGHTEAPTFSRTWKLKIGQFKSPVTGTLTLQNSWGYYQYSMSSSIFAALACRGSVGVGAVSNSTPNSDFLRWYYCITNSQVNVISSCREILISKSSANKLYLKIYQFFLH